jgi:hypothetical protein
MATTAIHLLGDISRCPADLCIIEREEKDHYIGHWIEGLGFINVHFPKATTRALTEAEIAEYDGRRMQINGTPLGRLHVRDHV